MLSCRAFRSHLKSVCASSLVLALLAGTAQAAICARPNEQAALEARVLQTELVVAALACDERKRYGAFVERFKRELVEQGGSFKSFFSRTRGGKANHEMNSLVTVLANEASQRSLQSGAFCKEAAALFEEVLKLEPRKFSAFAAARPFAASHGYEPCNKPPTVTASIQPPRAEAAQASMVPVAAAAPAPAEGKPAAPAIVPAVEVVPEASPAAEAAAAPAPIAWNQPPAAPQPAAPAEATAPAQAVPAAQPAEPAAATPPAAPAQPVAAAEPAQATPVVTR